MINYRISFHGLMYILVSRAFASVDVTETPVDPFDSMRDMFFSGVVALETLFIQS